MMSTLSTRLIFAMCVLIYPLWISQACLAQTSAQSTGAARDFATFSSHQTPTSTQEQAVSSRESELQGLIELAESYRDKFEPVRPDRVAKAKERLRAAMDAVQWMLREGDAETEQQWKDYLDWDAIEMQVENDKPSIAVLNNSIEKLTINQAGLERTEFLQLREAVGEFKYASVYANIEKLEDVYNRLLNSLIKALEQEIAEPSVRNANTIGQYAGALEDGEFAGELVKQVRRAFSHPNLTASVSERLICQLAASQEVKNESDIAEEILGTMQVGKAKTHGSILIDLVPSTSMAEMIIALEGITESEIVGRQDVPIVGPIEVYAEGKTRVHAESRLFLDGAGLTNSLADASAQTRTRINGVCSPALIRQIVKREIHKQSDKGNYIATKKAEKQLRDNLDEQIFLAVEKANRKLQEGLFATQVRLNTVPQYVAFSSTDNTLDMQLLLAGRYQSGAASPAPAISQTGDLFIQVHETVIGNQIEPLLSRQKLTNEQAMKLERGRVQPADSTSAENEPVDSETIAVEGDEDEDEIDESEGPWRITFSTFKPVEVMFRNNQLEATVLVRRIEESGRVVSSTPLAISAIFDLLKDEDGYRLVRRGDVSLLFRKPPSNEEIAVKANLVEPAQAMFPPEIPLKDVELPADSPVKGTFKIRFLEFSEGWMSIVADLVPAG